MTYLDIHTHSKILQPDVLQLVNVFPWEPLPVLPNTRALYSAGIHPWFIGDVNVNESVRQLEKWLINKTIICLGEAGLDGYRGPDRKRQLAVFEQHITLSETFKRPLLIHCVKRYTEVLSLRKQSRATQAWILHGFQSSVQMAEQFVNSGVYMSLGERVLKEPDWARSFCNQIPEEWLFLETDEGKSNITVIYEAFAKLKGQSVEAVKKRILENYKHVFA